MVLYPVYNGMHGFAVYKFGTEAIVIRNHNTLRHIPWNESDVRHIERLGDRDPGGVDLPRREQGTDHGAGATGPPGQQPEAAPVTAAQQAQQPEPRGPEAHAAGELGVPPAVPIAAQDDPTDAAGTLQVHTRPPSGEIDGESERPRSWSTWPQHRLCPVRRQPSTEYQLPRR